MNRDEINLTTIAGLDLDAVRITDEGYPHYLELAGAAAVGMSPGPTITGRERRCAS